MNFKRWLIGLLLIICLFLSVSAIGAVDDSNQLVNDTTGDALTVSEGDNLETADNEILSAGEGSFSDLSGEISEKSEYKLERDYTFNEQTDSGLTGGIEISNNITIDGQGHTIDAKGKARIFYIYISGTADITLKNIIFTNARASYGGAIYWAPDYGDGNIINCTFINNVATGQSGGAAIYEYAGISNVINSTFINNTASSYALYLPATKVFNSIFLNNGQTTLYGPNLEADYNWFGNTVDNYDTAPSVTTSIAVTKWYVLNITTNSANNVATLTLNNLYDGTEIKPCDTYALPSVEFNVWGTNATLNKDKVTLDANGNGSFGFTVTEATGNLTASCDGVSFTKNVINLADEGTISALNTKITEAIANGESEVKLYNDYNYTDSVLVKNTIAGGSNNGIGIATDFTIDGQGFTIGGNNKGGRIIYFRDSSKNLILKNINFVNCKDAYGGAIYATCKNLEIINCTFTDGTATGNPGAALYANVYGHYLIKNSIFTNNQLLAAGKNGGAIAIYTNQGTTGEILNCSFINNQGTSRGGAIFVNSNGGVGGDTLNINGCLFKGNVGNDVGSSIYIHSPCSYSISNSIILDTGNCIILSDAQGNVDYNWWGCTVDDYSTFAPENIKYGTQTAQTIPVNKWLYLDVVVDNDNSVAFVSLNNLNDGTVYENYALPKITLNVSATNANPNTDTITLNENGQATINYEMTDKTGTLTVSYDDIEITKEIKLFVQDSFTSLKKQIDENEESIFYLNQEYTYNSGFDEGLTRGIEITKSITIDGNGYTIDAKGLSNIFYLNDDSNSQILILKNIIFANANGTNGAAVYFKGNKIEIINCTFINNTAQSQGDAVYIDGAASNENEITGSTFINNSGANSVVYVNSNAELNLSNSIFIGNYAAVDVKGNANVVADYNWWGNVDEDKTNAPNVDGATVNNWLVLKITADTDTNIATVSLNNLYDGNVVSVYENYALPSINVDINGINVTVQKSTVTLDNEGKANTTLKLLRPDAVLTASYEGIETNAEIHYVIVDDGSFKALNDIVRFSSENDVIELTQDYVYSDSDTITTGIQITKTLTINGNNHIIDAKGKSGIFLINSPNVVFKNIIFKNGIFDNGGAIYASQNADYLTVDNCTFINNTATNTDGGAIWSGSYYFGRIVNSTFINNTSVEDGAAFFTYSFYEDAVVDRCVFINNSAQYSVIYAYYMYDFHDSIFLDNVGDKLIGGRYASSGTVGNNWYGNTYDDYNSQPVQMAVYNYNWLYLNIKFNETHAIVSLNNLYTKSSGSSSVYSNYNLPEITLNVNSTTLNLETDTITLDSKGKAIVPYALIGDEGALTVSYGGISFTKDRVLPEFGSLQTLIDNAEENSIIELSQNYTYNAADEITKGIIINKNITIDGKGHTIDVKQMTRIFNVQALNVTFKNIIFVNGKSNLRYDDGGNHGGAIYYKLDNTEAVNFNVINCTFINNIADVDNYNMKYSGGAIYIKANEGRYNIEDCTFINNTAKDKGGAIYLNTKNAEISLYNSTFMGNKAEHDGALYVETNATDVTIDKCLFRGNGATATSSYSSNGNAIIWKSINDSGNSVLKNSIIIDNGYNKANTQYTFLLISGNVNIDGNWWGTTYQNHPETFNSFFVNGATPNSWLFIKSEVFPEKLNFNETATVKYVLYSHDGTQISEFDNTKLPYVEFDVICDKGELNKDHVSLNEEFIYMPTQPGNALIDIYCNSLPYETTIHGSYFGLKVDIPFVMYANQNNLNINKLIKTANNYYTHVTVTCNDSSILGIDQQSSNKYISAYTKGGTAKLTFSYDGYYSGYPDAEELELVVNVFKVPLTINVTNIEGNEITLNVGDTLDLDIAFEIDPIHKGYAPAWMTLGFKCDSSIISFTYDNGERPENGSYYPTGHIVTKIGGTTNLTLYSTSSKFAFENYTLKITVNKIPTEITLDDDDSFKVDDTSKLNSTFLINGTPSTVALIYESSDENVINFTSSAGDFKAIGNGTAVLTVRFAGNSTHENSSKTITVTVTKYETTTSITSDKELSLKIDDESQITVDLTCEGVSLVGVINYASSDESVAIVDSNGKITAVGEGSAIITAKYDGNYKYANSSDSLMVTVSKIDSSITINTDNPLEINVFDESQIDAVLNHIGNLSYASSNPEVVTVNQTTGRITAKAGGRANITVSYSGDNKYEKAEDVNLTVIVKKLPSHITVDGSISVDVDANNNIVATIDNDRTLRYVSANPSIVTVDENTGVITGVIGGTANVTVIFDEDGQYLADEANVTVTVNKLQSTFTIENPLIEMDVYGNALIVASSNNDGEISYASCDVLIATVDGNNVTALKGGKVNITLSVAETDRYLSNATNITVTINKLQSTIVVTDAITVNVDERKSLDATVDKNRQLRYLSTNPNIVTVNSDGEITGVIGGTANVTVIFDEDDQYLGSEVNVTVTVNKLQSTFTIENPIIEMDVYGNALIIASSNNDGEITYVSCDALIATVDGNKVTALKGGKVNVTVSVAETERYLANETNVTITVNKLQSTIAAVTSMSVDVDGTNDIVASVDENRQLRFVSCNGSIVSVGELTGVVTGVIGGTANVTVIFDEDGQYLGSEVNVTVTVNKLHSTFTIDNPVIEMDVYGNALIIASSNNDGEITYVSCDALIATVDGNKVTALKGGKVNVTVSVAETERYLANETNVTITVNKLQSTIAAVTSMSVDVDGTNDIVASVDENRQLRFVSCNGSIVSVGELTGVVTGVIGGTANVTVIFDEDDQYLRSEVNVTVTVNKLRSTFTIDDPSIFVDVYGNVLIDISSNNDGILSFVSCDDSIATVDGNNVTGLKGGKVNVTVSAVETERYLANETYVTITVNKIQPTIVVASSMSVDVDETKSMGATVNENRPLYYLSTNSSIVTVNANGEITGIIGGTAIVEVIFDEDDQYLADKVSVTVTVKKLPSIFTNGPMSLSVDENATINSVLNHDGAVHYEFDSTKLNVTEDGLVIALAGGVHTIVVIFDGNERYLENSSTVTVTVSRLPADYEDEAINLTVFDTSNIEYLITGYDHTNSVYSSSNETVFTVDSNGIITAHAGGSALLNIKFPETDRYLGDSINITVNIKKLPTILTAENQISVNAYETKDLGIIANHNRQLIYESSNPNIVTVDDDGLIKGIIGGTAFITVRYDEDGQYLANSTRVDVTVNKLPSNINVETQAFEMYIDDEAIIQATTDNDGGLFFTTKSSIISLSGNGKVTGLSEGTADVIIAVFETDTHLSNRTTLKVTVKKIPTAINVEELQLTIDVDDSILINASLNHTGAGPLTYTSSNPEVVSVDGDGRICALIGGEANITVSYSGDDKYVAAEDVIVNVVSNRLPTVIQVNETISVDVYGNNTIIVLNGEGRHVHYLSTNPDIVTVNESTGVITGVIGGTANVTVIFDENERYLPGEVNVTVTVNKLPSIFTNGPMSLSVDENAIINSVLNHGGAVRYEFDSTKLNVTGDGLVIALAGGVHTIVVIFDGNERYLENTSTVTVTVNRLPAEYDGSPINLSVFDTSNIENIVIGYDHTSSVYSSSNETVFTVDENGLITAHAGGSAQLNIQIPETDRYNADSINITVNVEKLPSIFTGDNQISVKVGETKDLAVKVNHNRQLIYESGNLDIVTVDDNGLIKGIIGGTAFITVRYDGDDQYLANSTKVSVTVNKLPSNINVETPPITIHIGDETRVNATTDNDGGLFFTTNSSIISLSGDGKVTGLSQGTADIVIAVFETDTHLSNRTTLKVTVKKIPTAISVEGLQLTVDVDESILINASLNHPEAGPLNFTSSNPEVVSVDGEGRICALIGGEANITISYEGNDKYAAAQDVIVNVVSNRLPTVIKVNDTFSLKVDDSVMIGAFPSHDGMQLKYLVGNSSVITIDGATGEITAIAEGVTDVTISCEGTDKYLKAENVTVSVEVTRIQTEINISSENPIEINVFDESAIIARLNYTQAGILTYTSSDENVVTVDGDGMITAIGGGKANITVSYAGNYKYAPAENVTVSVVVNKLASSIIVDDELSVDVDNSKSLNAYMEIDRPLRYVSNNESIAFVDDYGFVTGLIGGKTNITVIFDGDSQYEGCEANVTVTVNKLASKIDVESQHLVIEVGSNAEIIATTNSDAYLAYVSLNSTIASVNGIVVTGVIGGTVNVTVSVPESDRYLASEVNVTVVVNKLQSVIIIENDNLEVDVDGTVNIVATTNSDGNLTYVSLDSAVASVEGNVVTGVAGGTVKVSVSVAETDKYLANEANVTVVVNKLQSVINLESDSLVVDVDGTVNIVATTNSDGNLTYVSLDSAVASVEGNVVTGVAGGTVKVSVSVAETDKYLANEANVTVVVNKLQSVINLESDSLVVDVDGNVLINASTNSDAGLTYVSLDPAVAAVEGNVVTGISSGIVNVTLSVSETARYLAKDMNVTVTVNKAKSVISANNITVYVDETKSIDATLNVDGNLRYINNNPELVLIDETGVVKGLIGGTAKITIIFDETDKYLGSEVNVTVTVNKLHSVIDLESDSLVVEVEGNVLINASTNSDAGLIYESLDESVATVNLNNVTALIGGKVIVSVSVPESDRYLKNSVNVTVVVKKHDSIISIENDEIAVEVDGKQQIVASTNSDRPIIFFTTSPIISIGGTGMVTGVSNGTAEVILNVAESDKYSANTSVVIVKVNKVPTAISVNESISVTVDDEINVNAALNHEGQLSFTSLDESIASVDAQGNIKAVKVGKTQIIVSFEENEKYLGNSITVDVTVNKMDIPINDTISMDLQDASRTPTFSIDLPNATGNFSVIVDGKEIGPVGLKEGKANITVPELAYGSHNVTVVYSGDDKYGSIAQNTTVNITKPVLSENKDIAMLYTANAEYKVHVTVEGKAIFGQIVTFKFNGKTYDVKTDKNGYATFKLPTAKPKKAKYTITATFHNVTVKNKVKVNSIIKAKNLKIKKSKRVVKIKVSLKKVNGKYLKGKQLKLKIKGKTLKAKTNKKGVATFKLKKKVLKKLKAGKKYKYKVIYGKDVVTKKLKVKR